MKSLTSILIFICVLIPKTNKAQDKIIIPNGDTIPVNIIKSTYHYIQYTYAGNKKIISVPKISLNEIHFRDGKIEICKGSDRISTIKGNSSRRDAIVLTNNVADIRGRMNLGIVKAYSNKGWRVKLSKHMKISSAQRNLRKESLKKGASIVLIRGQTFGKRTKLVGIAFR